MIRQIKSLTFEYCTVCRIAVPLQRVCSAGLQGKNLADKTIALFGCGDCESYGDTFVGGIGELYNGIKESGANFVGAVSTDGYTFDDSEAVVDGKFVGLPLDDVNEDDKTDARIDAWIADITPYL